MADDGGTRDLLAGRGFLAVAVRRLKTVVAWGVRHKVRAVMICIGLFLLVELATIPFFGIARLDTENPKETALMRQRVREADREGRKLTIVHRWVPLTRISRNLIDAVIVAEDGAFYSHKGVDWFEVRESIEKNVDQMRAARGASTITQQLAKNLYLSTSKDPVRKGKELAITFLMEQHLGKNRILEIYLNVIEWGRGIFGIEAAAQTFFGKPASALSLEESIRLAAVIPSPLRHRPDENSRYVLRRKQIVLRRLQARQPAAQGEEAEPSPALMPVDVPVEGAVDSSDTGEEEKNGP